jgi:hypothetical protein
MKNKVKKPRMSDEYTRSFGGKVTGFESRDEAMREKKHLKAYLKGHKVYKHGWKTVLLDENEAVEVMPSFTMRQPNILEVNEIWTKK